MKPPSTPVSRPGPTGWALLVLVGAIIPVGHLRAQASAPAPVGSVERAAHERVIPDHRVDRRLGT